MYTSGIALCAFVAAAVAAPTEVVRISDPASVSFEQWAATFNPDVLSRSYGEGLTALHPHTLPLVPHNPLFLISGCGDVKGGAVKTIGGWVAGRYFVGGSPPLALGCCPAKVFMFKIRLRGT
jgi:hypothetical protein